MSVKNLAKKILTQKENVRYKMLLAGKKADYSEWLEKQKLLWQEENEKIIPGESDDSDYVFFCAGKGMLTVCARKSVICYFKTHPDVQLLYGDEDVLGADGKACFPVFKPDWSPDLLDSCFYFGSIVAMRKDFFAEVEERISAGALQRTARSNDYLVKDFPEYVRWIRRCAELAGGYQKNPCGIGHVAQILFHCESREEQSRYREETPWHQERSRELLTDFRQSIGENGNRETSMVTVVIPSKDHPRLLEKCLKSVKNAAEGSQFEIIVVDNGSSAENRAETEKLVSDFSDEIVRVTYLYRPMEFNFSRMCNLGAEAAKGRFLLFLNDDVELAVQGCLEQMAALAARPYTGAVGMKLYYPESKKIQHAGITNLPMGPVHKRQFLEDGDANEYTCRGNVNYLAVTAACLMIERRKFQEAGGFAEELQVAFNDVDLCFKLYEAGYRNVCMNDCHAYHHESLSRGDDETVEKLERLLEEREKLYERHPELEGADPYYSVHLSREGLDTKIRPAYETAGNTVQEYDKFLAEKALPVCRIDECVMVRIEAVRQSEICGWSVVLGDNNACYEKELILKKEPGDFSPNADKRIRANGVHVIPLTEQYRPDLEENMPDQVNVALSGFHVRLKANLLAPGRYRLGVAVRHRITGARLMNWSNRLLQIV